jgi:histidinol-phosphate aminotransferase
MNKNISQLIRKNILELSPYSSAREEYKGSKGVFLDANENPYGSYNRYPDPYQRDLKQLLSEIKNISKNQIFIGNGSDEVIDIAFRIFCEPNQDKALTFTPTYGMYDVSAKINAVELIKIPLKDSFQIDLEKVKPFLNDDNLKLIFICSPNNPTGNLLNVTDIEFVLQNFKGIVIIDEAYIDFCKQTSFIEKIKEYSNLIVSQTLSKAWGLAGIRIGIAFMNSDILSYYNKVKPPYNISLLNQQKALETLRNIEKFEKQLNEILSERNAMIQELKKLNMVREIYRTDANFVLVKVDYANQLYTTLVEQQLIVRNRNSVVQNCLRISIGTKEENYKLLTALKQIDNG